MYDAVFVLADAYTRLLKKKPDQFRTVALKKVANSGSSSSSGHIMLNGGGNFTGNNGNNGGSPSNNANVNSHWGLECNITQAKVEHWEHGEKIARYLRKVSE